MTGLKTNERPGTRAQVRFVRVSAYKAREVLDLIRGLHVADADQVLAFTERDVARVVRKALASAVANAQNNDSHDPDTLKVVACYADEGPTLKRWRPRARGRATRIRKRTCHITVIVGRYSPEELDRMRAKLAEKGRTTTDAAAARARRVARSRAQQAEESAPEPEESEAAQAEATEEYVEETFAEDAEDAGVAEESAAEETSDVADENDESGEAEDDQAEAEVAAEADDETGKDD